MIAAALASLLVLAGGAAVTWGLTDELQAFTTESARRLGIDRTPRPVPAVAWRPALGGPGLGAPGPVRIVDFVYTRCPSVCQSLGGVYGQLQRDLHDEIARGEVALVSVGFDLAHDTPQALQRWRELHGAGAGWQAVAPASSADLDRLQRAFGVVIRPDGAGGFVHNAALSVVDRQGRLVAVFDLDQWPAAVARARDLLGQGGAGRADGDAS